MRDVAKMLGKEGASGVQIAEEHASALLCHETWEGRHGGLLLVQECLKWFQESQQPLPNVQQWADSCLKLLSDSEVRVRTTSGEVLALLCHVGGMKLYDDKVAEHLLASIENNMNLERDGQAFLDGDEATKKLSEKLLAGEAARQNRVGSRASRASSMQSSIFHDTAGWGTLETDVSCLQQIIEKCGADFAPRLDSHGEVLELLCTCALHMNRFVRGIGFRAIDAVIKSLHEAGSTQELGKDSSHQANSIKELGEDSHNGEVKTEFLLDSVAQASDFVARIGSGLCDEWANVRMEASVALRTFLLCLQTVERRQCFYDELLPKLCVNRYYVAAGVANYTRETWRLIIGDQGRQTVARWLPSLVPFYIMQTKVANSEARDAAAKCIGELAARIDRVAVSSYVKDLFEALIPRLSKQDAWQVKESSSNAVVEMVRAFPECFNLSADLPRLVPSLSAILADKIWSVREGAAVALGELVKVSDANAAAPILELCLDGLKSASKETDEREKYGKDDLVELKRERDNDVELHTDQDTIDCCAVGDLEEDDSEQLGKLSLSKIYNQAQKSKIDMGLNSWERTDGCLYLVRELAFSEKWKGSEKNSEMEKVLQQIASISKHRHFVKHLVLLATLWKVLPETAKAIGTPLFKKHVPGLLDSLAYSITCEDNVTANAAKTCLSELDCWLGPGVLSESVRLHNEALLEQFASLLSPPVGQGAPELS